MRKIRTVTLIAVFTAAFLMLGGAFTRETTEAEEITKAEGARYALLVGVNEYMDETNFAPLAYAESDVELIREKLVSVLKFRPEDITVLTTGSGFKNIPLRKSIEEKLIALVNKARRGDVIFFMFAGHGFEKSGEDWLCPADGMYDSAEDTALSVKAIMKTLDKTEASFKLMVVDACRENRATRRGAEPIKPYRTIEDPPKGLLLYQSCKSGEFAHSDPELKHGIFSYYLAESFEKGDTDADGMVTFFDIIKYTDTRVRDHARKLFQNETQEPSINTSGISDFIMVDGLQIDNVSLEDWQRADELYQDARESRENGNLTTARSKIAEALKITEKAVAGSSRREPYKEEEKRIREGLADELAEAAARLFEEGKNKEALGKIKESLSLKDTWTSQYLKKQIEERLKGGELPKEYVNSQGQRMVLIQAGEFMMGDTLTAEEVDKKYPGGKISWYEDAHPRHRVKISKPYYMGAYEVTVGEFRKFVNATGYKTTAEKEGTAWGYDKDGEWGEQKGLNWRAPGIEQGDNHPVTCVSWEDAREYIKWLNKQEDPKRPEGYVYALPSEAQWEYACRAGSETSFYWGEDESGGKGYLNGAGTEGAPNGEDWTYHFPFNDGYKGTSPVGSFKPNDWGLYDMLGNVWEWCQDWYDEDYYEKSPEQDPPGPGSGSSRVYRGGGWGSLAGSCRFANRSWYVPGNRRDDLGLRLALVRQ